MRKLNKLNKLNRITEYSDLLIFCFKHKKYVMTEYAVMNTEGYPNTYVTIKKGRKEKFYTF